MSTPQSSPVYRIDRFIVPMPARAEFEGLVARMHAILRDQPGLVGERIFASVPDATAAEILTFAEWRDQDSYEAAVTAVRRLQKEEGFDRGATIARLGIKADIGTYRRL